MNVPLKLAAFTALLVVVFLVALAVGAAVGPVDLHPASNHMNGGAAATVGIVPIGHTATSNPTMRGVGR